MSESNPRNGKGSAPRPYSITKTQFNNNWEGIFGRKLYVKDLSGLLRYVGSFRNNTLAHEDLNEDTKLTQSEFKDVMIQFYDKFPNNIWVQQSNLYSYLGLFVYNGIRFSVLITVPGFKFTIKLDQSLDGSLNEIGENIKFR